MENQHRTEIQVSMVSKYDVNAHKTDDGTIVIILQDVPQDNNRVAIVGLPFATREELDQFIVELIQMRDITWPNTGAQHAKGKNGNDESVDRKEADGG